MYIDVTEAFAQKQTLMDETDKIAIVINAESGTTRRVGPI